MPPIQVNRRRFLGCSAAAGIALAQGMPADGGVPPRPVRLGLIGLGNRGTTLLRTALEIPGVEVAAVHDAEPRHANRAQGIAEKARGHRPEACETWTRLLERTDLDAVAIALPCDLHAAAYVAAMRAGKHLYAEKPLAPTVAECDALIDESARAADLIVHVGFQRRSSARYREAVELIGRGELGTLVEGRASWISSNGPVNGHDGWLARRERSGDWMVEQAVHVWDLFHWIRGSSPTRAFGHGRRDLFAAVQPDRDVTDHYSVTLEWADGFHLHFTQSWIDPADDAFTGAWQRVIGTAGGLDLGTGVATFRDRARPRRTLGAGQGPDAPTGLPAFIDAVRRGTAGATAPPASLIDAREATITGLLVRRAVDERRAVLRDEVLAAGHLA
ncbi:MAG: Gfo/Idh/MocA family oxidoreductase [Isosphaeraceae bacterium]